MRTLGVDLASRPERTAICTVEWADGRARLVDLALGATDDDIVHHAHRADALGIDAPFGWPAPFVEMLTGHGTSSPWTPAHRDDLRFRGTDRFVHQQTGRWPLSVSSDLIGVVAMRCQGLLQSLGVRDRGRHPNVFEVYPAAALARWGFRRRSYKGAAGAAALESLAADLVATTPWLTLTADSADLLRRSDDALDALLSSLIARAAHLGRVDPAPEDRRSATEGWIALPTADSLPKLAGDS